MRRGPKPPRLPNPPPVYPPPRRGRGSKSRSSRRGRGSKSRGGRSKSRRGRSKSRGGRSKSRDGRSNSRGPRSKSRGGPPKSRGRRSNSRGGRSSNSAPRPPLGPPAGRQLRLLSVALRVCSGASKCHCTAVATARAMIAARAASSSWPSDSPRACSSSDRTRRLSSASMAAAVRGAGRLDRGASGMRHLRLEELKRACLVLT